MTDTHNFVRKQTTGSLILKSGSATVVRWTENRSQVKKQQDRMKNLCVMSIYVVRCSHKNIFGLCHSSFNYKNSKSKFHRAQSVCLVMWNILMQIATQSTFHIHAYFSLASSNQRRNQCVLFNMRITVIYEIGNATERKQKIFHLHNNDCASQVFVWWYDTIDQGWKAILPDNCWPTAFIYKISFFS